MRPTGARLSTECAPNGAPDTSRDAAAAAIEAEQYFTPAQYARVLRVTERWVEDHCLPEAPQPRLVHSRLGRHLRFSPEDRAENRRRAAVQPSAPAQPEPPSETAALPTDPVELAKLLANLRRVTAPV